MTTLVGQNPNAMQMDPNTGGPVLNAPGGQPSYLTGQMGQQGNMMMANPHMSTMSGQPGSHMMMQAPHPAQLNQFRMAPIGSASAEFENDFIGVFPHHHLQPCPDM